MTIAIIAQRGMIPLCGASFDKLVFPLILQQSTFMSLTRQIPGSCRTGAGPMQFHHGVNVLDFYANMPIGLKA
jgi:hypothetical protein